MGFGPEATVYTHIPKKTNVANCFHLRLQIEELCFHRLSIVVRTSPLWYIRRRGHVILSLVYADRACLGGRSLTWRETRCTVSHPKQLDREERRANNEYKVCAKRRRVHPRCQWWREVSCKGVDAGLLLLTQLMPLFCRSLSFKVTHTLVLVYLCARDGRSFTQVKRQEHIKGFSI